MSADRPADGAPSPHEPLTADKAKAEILRWIFGESNHNPGRVGMMLEAFESAVRAESVSALRAVERERDRLAHIVDISFAGSPGPIPLHEILDGWQQRIEAARAAALEEAAKAACYLCCDYLDESPLEDGGHWREPFPGERANGTITRVFEVCPAARIWDLRRALSPGAATPHQEGTDA